jgi:Tfp pilus assembly protein PilF
VAWTAELKDVLSAFFSLLALLAYTRYVVKRSAAWYALVAAWFALALMSKASTVALPILLLLVDYWPLGRLRSDSRRSVGALVLEKLPLVGLAAGMSAVTLLTFQDTTLRSTAFKSLTYRAVMSLQAYLAYLVQTVVPLELAPHYPYVPLEHPLRYAVLPVMVLGAITAFAVWQRRARPYLLMGWLWFLVAIAPVSGILPIGSHFRADRYTYLAHIGLFVALVWGAADLVRARPRLRRPVQGLAAAAILACAALSYVNVGYWRDNLTLFSRAVRIVPGSSLMHSGLALTYIQRDQFDLAEVEFKRALQATPDQPEALFNYGLLLVRRGRMDEAAAKFERLLAAQPDHAQALYSLSICRAWRGRRAEALDLLKRAIALEGALAKQARNDPFFAPLRETQDFTEIIQ